MSQNSIYYNQQVYLVPSFRFPYIQIKKHISGKTFNILRFPPFPPLPFLTTMITVLPSNCFLSINKTNLSFLILLILHQLFCSASLFTFTCFSIFLPIYFIFPFALLLSSLLPFSPHMAYQKMTKPLNVYPLTSLCRLE